MKIGDLVRLNEAGQIWYRYEAVPWDHIALIIGYDHTISLSGIPGGWKLLCNETNDGMIMVVNEQYWEVINE